VDRARVRVARKRDAQMEPLSVSMDGRARGSPNVIEVLLLDELLERLAEFDARTAQVTEMRVFLGLTEDENRSGLARIVTDSEARLGHGRGVAEGRDGSPAKEGLSPTLHFRIVAYPDF
jgi:ECF sigma factor